jgi:lysozyme family protein
MQVKTVCYCDKRENVVAGAAKSFATLQQFQRIKSKYVRNGVIGEQWLFSTIHTPPNDVPTDGVGVAAAWR